MRADTIPSTPEARRAEHLRVRRDLALNGYTEATYQRGKYRKRATAPGTTPNTPATATNPMPQIQTPATATATTARPADQQRTQKHLGHISIPYCKGIAEPMARMLRQVGISTSFASRGSLKEQLVHLKDPVPRLQVAGTVYHIECQGSPVADCTASYVGETGRSTEDRMKDHKANTKHPNGLYTSKVKEHMHNQDHFYIPNSITILDKDDKWRPRGIRESIHIRALSPTLNADQGRHKLPHCYDNIIRNAIAPTDRRKIETPKDTAGQFQLPTQTPQNNSPPPPTTTNTPTTNPNSTRVNPQNPQTAPATAAPLPQPQRKRLRSPDPDENNTNPKRPCHTTHSMTTRSRAPQPPLG
jgi:hypothetical protein